MSQVKKLLSKPLKRLLRDLKSYAADLKERRLYRERSERGEDIWVEPVLHCRKVRLGRGDGEWFVNPDRLGPGSIVYSVGVGLDISFDTDLIDRYGVELHAFDPTPISREWLDRQTIPAKFHFHSLGLASYDGFAEFQLPVEHGVSFTMLSGLECRQNASCEVARLGTILERFGHRHIDLLKLDIEGAEYDIIDDIVAHRDRISQLLIEFHHRMVPGIEGMNKTKDALKRLADAGFKLFYVSSRGLEYCFLRE
jgi:FkbM family methyltransferase